MAAFCFILVEKNNTCDAHNGFTERLFSRVQTGCSILSTCYRPFIEYIQEYRVSTYLVQTSYGE